MIAILPLRDRAALQKLNEAEHTNASHAYCLYDGGEIAAYLLYDMHENEAVLQKLGGTWDANIADGLCRAAFSSLLDLNIDRARFSNAIDRALTDRLGFTSKSDTVASIRSILYRCKSCECRQ